MSWRVVGYGLAGWLVAACIIAPWIGRRLRNMQPYVCAHCRDEGWLVVNTAPSTSAFCNFCMLGQQYEHASVRRNQEETK